MEIGWQKVLSDSGSGSFLQIRDAILYENVLSKQKIEEGYSVIYSFSLGGGTAKQQQVEEALKQAQDLGVLIAAASGNNNNAISYPGNSDYSHAIGSLQKGTPPSRSSFSN